MAWPLICVMTDYRALIINVTIIKKVTSQRSSSKF